MSTKNLIRRDDDDRSSIESDVGRRWRSHGARLVVADGHRLARLLGLVVVLIVTLVRHFTQINPTRGPAAEAVLAERFARGEIDENEFRRRRQALRV